MKFPAFMMLTQTEMDNIWTENDRKVSTWNPKQNWSHLNKSRLVSCFRQSSRKGNPRTSLTAATAILTCGTLSSLHMSCHSQNYLASQTHLYIPQGVAWSRDEFLLDQVEECYMTQRVQIWHRDHSQLKPNKKIQGRFY